MSDRLWILQIFRPIWRAIANTCQKIFPFNLKFLIIRLWYPEWSLYKQSLNSSAPLHFLHCDSMPVVPSDTNAARASDVLPPMFCPDHLASRAFSTGFVWEIFSAPGVVPRSLLGFAGMTYTGYGKTDTTKLTMGFWYPISRSSRFNCALRNPQANWCLDIEAAEIVGLRLQSRAESFKACQPMRQREYLRRHPIRDSLDAFLGSDFTCYFSCLEWLVLLTGR